MLNKKVILCLVVIFISFFQFNKNILIAQFNDRSSASQSNQRVTVSFDYNKVSRSASNQFAVWVTDKDGKFIKTLYVTKFTASGGYNKRPDSLPLWSKAHSKAGLDAVTKATPDSSKVVCSWDFTDINGQSVSKGDEYFLYIEATTYMKDNVLYKAAINSKSIGKLAFDIKYSNNNAKKSNMIENMDIIL